MRLSTCWSVEQAAWERPGAETPCQESRPGTELLIHVVYAQKAVESALAYANHNTPRPVRPAL